MTNLNEAADLESQDQQDTLQYGMKPPEVVVAGHWAGAADALSQPKSRKAGSFGFFLASTRKADSMC
jgi:hypothetical protein